ncbi:MAG: PH domain-containing protein [Flavobacteriaceae bacterium]|nr:PH domain-containing protein [Flavobacteriaceae bacterium]
MQNPTDCFIPLSRLPNPELSFFCTPEKSLRFILYFNYCLFFVAAFLGLGITYFISKETLFLYLILSVSILFFLGLYLVYKNYKSRGYALRDEDLTYKHGWLFAKTTTVPFNRIQHVELSENPLERNLKLAKISIYTAGGSSSDLSLKGLSKTDAERIKSFLTEKIARYA